MGVHIPESPLKYGLFGLFSFLGRVCISRLHTGVRPYAHGCAGPRVCMKKPDGYVNRQAIFYSIKFKISLKQFLGQEVS